MWNRRLLCTGIGLLGCAFFLAAEIGRSADSSKVLGNIPAKVHGRWPNDARGTFWYGDYETASQVARRTGRPIFLVINRGATCEV